MYLLIIKCKNVILKYYEKRGANYRVSYRKKKSTRKWLQLGSIKISGKVNFNFVLLFVYFYNVFYR